MMKASEHGDTAVWQSTERSQSGKVVHENGKTGWAGVTKAKTSGVACKNDNKSGNDHRLTLTTKTAPSSSRDAGMRRMNGQPTSVKPRVLTDAVFMWVQVASLSAPQQVCELERVCHTIAAALREASTGTRVMQRYWNAQWSRLLWSEEALPREKRFLFAGALSRSEGKKDWRALFVEEYPRWVQRTYRGVGSEDNAYNEAKALFHRERLNEVKSAAELAASELSVAEAFAKAMAKRGVVVVESEVVAGKRDSTSAPTTTHGATQSSGGGKRAVNAATVASINGVSAKGELLSRHVMPKAGASGAKREDKKLARVAQRAVTVNLTREDYQMDRRQGTRKGKHGKGGEKQWSAYDTYGDYDY